MAAAWSAIPRSVIIALGLCLAALAFGFRSTWSAMAHVWWTSETFGHGMAVAPIAAWLIWRKRAALQAARPSPSWIGVAALLICCAAWLIAELAGINVVAQFAATASLGATALAILGPTVTRTILFPLAFLLFMVPAGEGLNPPLMELTADATVWALQATGIPVFREGLHFSLPTGRWSVVEACSGLRYVIAAAMLGTLFAHLNFRSGGKQVAFVSAALSIALVANWARAFLIVLVGHFSGMTLGVGDDHVVYGWVFFGAVMFAVFWLGAMWRDSDDAARSRIAILRTRAWPSGHGSNARFATSAPAIAAVLLVGTTVSIVPLFQDVRIKEHVAERALAAMGAGKGGLLELQPRFPTARAVAQGVVDRTTGTGWYAAYFARQSDGREMIAFGNSVVNPEDSRWQSTDTRWQSVSGNGVTWAVRERSVRSGDRQLLIWSWYTIGGRSTASEYRAKFLTAWSMVRGRGDHSIVAVVMTEVADGGEATSRERMQEVATLLRAFSEKETAQ